MQAVGSVVDFVLRNCWNESSEAESSGLGSTAFSSLSNQSQAVAPE